MGLLRWRRRCGRAPPTPRGTTGGRHRPKGWRRQRKDDGPGVDPGGPLAPLLGPLGAGSTDPRPRRPRNSVTAPADPAATDIHTQDS